MLAEPMLVDCGVVWAFTWRLCSAQSSLFRPQVTLSMVYFQGELIVRRVSSTKCADWSATVVSKGLMWLTIASLCTIEAIARCLLTKAGLSFPVNFYIIGEYNQNVVLTDLNSFSTSTSVVKQCLFIRVSNRSQRFLDVMSALFTFPIGVTRFATLLFYISGVLVTFHTGRSSRERSQSGVSFQGSSHGSEKVCIPSMVFLSIRWSLLTNIIVSITSKHLERPSMRLQTLGENTFF